MASSAICLLPRTIKPNATGTDVIMMKRALSMAGFGKWLGMLFTRRYGKYAVTLMKRFQKAHGLKQDGVYGPDTHRKLAKYYDNYGMNAMNTLAHKMQIENDPAVRMVTAYLAIYNYCSITGRGTYTQSSSRMSIIRNKWRPPFRVPQWLKEDCSSSATGGCWIAKVPDPNGLGYNLQGYTGTLSVHGFRVMMPTLGCMAFYGPWHPYKHVTVCVGIKNGRALVFSWGSGLPRILDAHYRGDLNHWRGGYARNMG